MATVEEMKIALEKAAMALEIADDWNLPAVQIDPPKEWGLPGANGESQEDGWCSTYALAQKLRELAS